MRIGSVWLYRGKPVYITGGQYESRGRVSNFWNFRYINEDGSLGKSGGDYHNGPFTDEIKSAKIIIKVDL